MRHKKRIINEDPPLALRHRVATSTDDGLLGTLCPNGLVSDLLNNWIFPSSMLHWTIKLGVLGLNLESGSFVEFCYQIFFSSST